MGQAKKRGTYEERVAHARLRNLYLAREIMKSDHAKLKRGLRLSGPHRMAQAMISLGVFKPADTAPKVDWPTSTPVSPILRPPDKRIVSQ